MRAFSKENFKDGWEIWLQCESYNILQESAKYQYSRGTAYPHPYGGKKCDFLFRRDNISLWLELKVLLQGDVDDLIDRFVQDLDKIYKIDIPSESNSVGAFAVIPLKASELFSQKIKDRFKEKSKVDIKDIGFLAVEPGVGNLAGSYNSHQQIDNDRIVILYYIRID
jgi:hypothetical protein